MILLVVGLVAVIVVVLIAVFLSIRLGRGDEHDELDSGPSGRDRHRGQSEGWQEPGGHRVPSPASRTAARSGRDPGYGPHGPRERGSRGRGHDGAARRPSRPPAPGYRAAGAARAVGAARPAVGASATAAHGRYGTGHSRRIEDHRSADYPSLDFGPGSGYPTGDHPSLDFPVGDYGATPDPRRGRESRRRPAPAAATGKTRSRQRGDDDDWPSTEWDNLSDEQYWAELAADKPLSSTARPGKAASTAAAAASFASAAANSGRAVAARDPLGAGPAETDPPGRRNRALPREPVTVERLPVRGRQAPATPVPSPRSQPGPATAHAYPGPRSVAGTGPRYAGDTGPLAAWDTGPQARDTGPLFQATPRSQAAHRRPGTGPEAAPDRDLPTLPGIATTAPPLPGVLADDPLTSPSFSLRAEPASDSRSYRNARKHAKSGQPDASGNGTASSGPPVGDYADAGYGYHSAPPAAVPPPASPADWYSPPAEQQTPVYGNPYQRTGYGHGSAGYTDSQPATGYPGYLADPLRVYTPGYQMPSPYTEPAGPAGYQQPATGTAPYGDGYPQHSSPAQTAYTDGYVPGYDRGYEGGPHAAGGDGPYPPQG